MKTLKIGLVAGEVSGDILGADLICALKQFNSDYEFIGIGGERMLALGLKSIFPMERLSVMGLSEVLGRVPELLWRRYKLAQTLIAAKIDIFIGIDAPDFNLDLELKLRSAGIKTIHYVSPSVWAWRQNRIIKIKQACDLMLTLLPFEADFYQKANMPVKFVGHPLADSITVQDMQMVRRQLSLAQDKVIIALMPGSRASEINKLGKLFLESANIIWQKNPQVEFVVPCVNDARFKQLQNYVKDYQNLPITIIKGKSQQVLNACDLVILASGTATLEAMLYQKPMVVVYKLSRISFWLLKKMVQTKFIALPNLLANKDLVPELIQNDATENNIAQKTEQVLLNPNKQTVHFIRLTNLLKQDSSIKAAGAVLALCKVI